MGRSMPGMMRAQGGKGGLDLLPGSVPCCAQVLALMSCDVQRMGHIQCHVEQAKWKKILDVRALLCPLPAAALPAARTLCRCVASCLPALTARQRHDGCLKMESRVGARGGHRGITGGMH
jgi:hypothetical protein